MSRPLVAAVIGALLAATVAGCGNTAPAASSGASSAAASASPAGQGSAATTGNAPGLPVVSGEVQQTASGLRYVDEVVGSGPAARAGQTVTVQYTGWLTNGQRFDSSRDRGQPFAFRLGAGDVIEGWDQGVAGMQTGGKRRLIVPPALGYGARGVPGAIPPNATLLFDVELLGAR